MTGSLLIVTGPPGAGKSSVAAHLARTFERSALVAGDDFFAHLREGRIEPWLPESDEQNGVVTDAAAAATGVFARGGYDTVYDGVLGPWFLDRFVAGLGVERVDYVILLPPLDTCVARVHARRRHGFRDEVATRKMHGEFAGADIAHRHLMTGPDVEGDVAAVAAAILHRRAGGDLRLRRDHRR